MIHPIGTLSPLQKKVNAVSQPATKSLRFGVSKADAVNQFFNAVKAGNWAAVHGVIDGPIQAGHFTINEADEVGNTALHMAAEQGNTLMVKILLEHGASVNAQNETGEFPFQLAVKHPNDEAARLLREHMPEISKGFFLQEASDYLKAKYTKLNA